VTTVEGIINRAVAGLEQDQPARREQHLEVAQQIDQFIDTLNELKNVNKPFTLVSDKHFTKLILTRLKTLRFLKTLLVIVLLKTQMLPKQTLTALMNTLKGVKSKIMN